MKKLLFILAGALAIISCQQKSNDAHQGDLDQIGQAKINQKDEPSGFLDQAAMGNMMEIRSGQIAQHSENPAVRELATMILKDHEQAQKELMTMAEENDLYAPTAVPPHKQSALMHLDSLTGAERDYQYVELMVSEHEAAVPLFRKMASQQGNAKLVEFAKAKLPAMEHHLQTAKKLLATLQDKQKAGRSGK